MNRFLTMLLLAATAVLAPACETTQDYEWGGTQNQQMMKVIDRRVAELRYQKGTELMDSLTALVAYGDQGAPAVRKGLKSDDWLTRAGCAYVSGVSGDRRYVYHVRPLLKDSNADVRYEAAAALVDLRDGAGFYTLVDGLEDADVKRRYKCIQVLQRATSHDFGYVHDASASIRKEAVLRWREWLKEREVESL